jgi:outer membrane lipoprotein LolB
MAAGRLWHVALLTVLTLLTSACVTAPSGTVDQSQGKGEVRDFTLAGRLAIRQPERSDVLRLDWQHLDGHERIALSTPLGGQVMLLEEQPGHVRLALPDRAPVEASDDLELMQSLLGYTLPVRGLADWVLGRVPPPGADLPGEATGAVGASSEAVADRTVHFIQDGWSGSLQRWRPVGSGLLPGLITVERNGLQLRLVVDQWTVRRAAP